MLKYKFYGRSELVRLRGKYTVQSTHCAMDRIPMNANTATIDHIMHLHISSSLCVIKCIIK